MIEWLSENALWLGALGAVAAIIALFTSFLKSKPEGNKVTAKGDSVAAGGNIIGEVLNPDNVTMIVSLVGAAVSVSATAIKGMQLWFDEKKSRKIRVQYEELEVEITGAHSEDELRAQLEAFKSLKEELDHRKVRIELID